MPSYLESVEDAVLPGICRGCRLTLTVCVCVGAGLRAYLEYVEGVVVLDCQVAGVGDGEEVAEVTEQTGEV